MMRHIVTANICYEQVTRLMDLKARTPVARARHPQLGVGRQEAPSAPLEALAKPFERIESLRLGVALPGAARRLAEADRAAEDEVRAFHLGEGAPVVSHFVAEHLPKSHEGRSHCVR